MYPEINYTEIDEQLLLPITCLHQDKYVSLFYSCYFKPKKEVFYIKDNVYNYEEAKAVCKAHDAELADYNLSVLFDSI